MKKTVIDGKEYSYDVILNNEATDDAVHIVQPCHNSTDLTRLSVACIKKYTEQPYILWIVDNCSDRNTRVSLSGLNNVNIILNHTKIGSSLPWRRTPHVGSLSNAVALELAAHVIGTCKYMFVMHNDCVPVRSGWLGFLKSKINDKVKIVGVSQDKTRVCAVHQSGFLFDFELFRKLNLSFMPRLPEYDVGDGITLGFMVHGYKYFVCQNTFNNPETVHYLDNQPEFLRKYNFDRSFNDNGDLIYMHMGRGSSVFRDIFRKNGRVPRMEWIKQVNYVLKSKEMR